MELKGSKKIILLGIILLIVAGIVVVALKGFKVSLTLQKHESLNIVVGKEITLKDAKEICEDVFGNKRFVVKHLDRFEDAINVRVESITNEEKVDLVKKINEKYEVNIEAANVAVKFNSNIRIRDILKLYFKPVVISTVLIIAFVIVRFRNSNPVKILANVALKILVTEGCIASVISITRIPLSSFIINVMAVVAVVELVLVLESANKKTVEEVK